jgi:DNA-binding CsgD family transcriptional regulator
MRIPLLGPAVRLHRRLAHGTSADILESVRAMRTRGPVAHVAVATAQKRARLEGRDALTAEDVAEATGMAPTTVAPKAGPSSGLTAREAEIVALVRDDLSNREIASRLFLSVRTVESHLYRAMQKLGVSDRRSLVG